MTTVGIIGIGYLGECLAEGLAAADTALILSPRNTERAHRLAEQFGCTIAKDNADVVARADVVFLATRPGDIASTATGLPWREEQRVISVAAGVRLETIQNAIIPAMAIRAMPISASRIQSSPTAFCPNDPIAADVLGRLGSAHPFPDEAQFSTASIFGAYYALIFAFIDEASNWAEDEGLEPEAARHISARMVQAAASSIIANIDRPPRALLDDLMTPGGITEEGLKVLEDADAFAPWSAAMNASLKRARDLD